MPVCSPARCTECTGLHVGHAHNARQRARELSACARVGGQADAPSSSLLHTAHCSRRRLPLIRSKRSMGCIRVCRIRAVSQVSASGNEAPDLPDR